MGEKNRLIRLSDSDSTYVCPITKSDGVFMQDGNTTLTTKMNEVTSHLEQIKKQTKIFKPKFNRITYFGHSKDMFGGYDEKSLEQLEGEISTIKKLGFDGVYIIIHTAINKLNNTLYIPGGNYVEKINFIIDSCKKKNLEITAIKIHCEQVNGQLELETINNSCGLESFKIQYKNIVNDIVSKFDMIDTFILFNELPYFYASEEQTDYCVEILKFIQGKGKKVSISNTGIVDFYKMTDRLKETVDFFSLNFYPTIGYNGINTTYSESQKLIIDTGIFECFDYMKKYDKEIVITETGCPDIEEALVKPWYWNFDDMTRHNGEIQQKFLKCIFTMFNTPKNVCYWWDLDLSLENYIKENLGRE